MNRLATRQGAGGFDLKARTGVCHRKSGGNVSGIVETRKPMTAAPVQFRKQMPLPVADDPRWAHVVARDKTADGQFWYSVSTTGVYCRPSCPSRTANPKNVQLHDSLASAKATGFRPCRRCNPDGPSVEAENTALVAKVCRIIEMSEEEPSLEDLAGAVGLSPGYFHRVFKTVTGLTPKSYAAGSCPLRSIPPEGQTRTSGSRSVKFLSAPFWSHRARRASPLSFSGTTRRSSSMTFRIASPRRV